MFPAHIGNATAKLRSSSYAEEMESIVTYSETVLGGAKLNYPTNCSIRQNVTEVSIIKVSIKLWASKYYLLFKLRFSIISTRKKVKAAIIGKLASIAYIANDLFKFEAFN